MNNDGGPPVRVKFLVMSSVSFSSVTSERLAWSFKMQVQDKNLDKNHLCNMLIFFGKYALKMVI
jgi:hypothetical protein